MSDDRNMEEVPGKEKDALEGTSGENMREKDDDFESRAAVAEATDSNKSDKDKPDFAYDMKEEDSSFTEDEDKKGMTQGEGHGQDVATTKPVVPSSEVLEQFERGVSAPPGPSSGKSKVSGTEEKADDGSAPPGTSSGKSEVSGTEEKADDGSAPPGTSSGKSEVSGTEEKADDGSAPPGKSKVSGTEEKADDGSAPPEISSGKSEVSGTEEKADDGSAPPEISSGKSEVSGTEEKADDMPIPREFEPLWGILSQIPKKAQRGLLMQCDLILTCVSVDESYIALGTNIGLIFLYDRKKHSMERLKTDTPSDVVTCIQLHRGIDYQLAVGMASGAVCMFMLPSMMTGLNKQLQKFHVKDMHRSYLTCVEWSTNGMKLFSGDKSGTVVTTEVDFYQGQCKSTILLIETHTEIIQLHYDHKVLLVSTKQRSLICRLDDRDRLIQVGQQDRKLLGGFGACFIPGLCKVSDAQLYASRPGCRLWKADVNGTVKNTFLFKDLVGSSNPDIPLFKMEKSMGSQEPQFGKLYIYRSNQLLTWTPLGMFILDPESNAIIAGTDRLGYIADVSVCNDEIFVLRRNVECSLIRIAEKAEVPMVKNILSSIPSQTSAHSPSASASAVSRDSHVTSANTSSGKAEKESKHVSPGRFIKKNILGKFKFLDRPSRESDLQQEVSVKQMIDDDDTCKDGHNCSGKEAIITSPDLPPVVKINSPELTALQVYAGITGSPMSPEASHDLCQISTFDAQSGELILNDPVPQGRTTSGEPQGSENWREGEDHLSLISERIQVGKKVDTGDIVFAPKAKKHKKKKHKTDKSAVKEEDAISQNSDTSQTLVDETADTIDAVEETTPSPVDTLEIANEILKRTAEMLKSKSTEENDEENVEEQGFQDGMDSLSSIASEKTMSLNKTPETATPSSEGSEFNPANVPYTYNVDEKSLPDVNNTDYKIHRLGKMARELSSGYGTDPAPSVSDVSGRDQSLSSGVLSPVSPSSDPLRSKSNLYMTSDTSTEDFYKKYMSQSSIDSNITSPSGVKQSSPEPESDQASPEDVPPPASVAALGADDKVAAGTLLKLANSWSEIITPTNVYSLVVSETHIWFTDKSENIYYSSLSGVKGVVWRKASGQAKQIAVSSSGSIVWRLQKSTVYAGTKLSSRRPEGLKWVDAVKDVSYISVDDNCAWYIKTNGDVMMQKGLSAERPCFKSLKVDGNERLKLIMCRGHVVWGITENHKVVYRSGVTEACQEGTEWKKWSAADDILFSHITLGDEGTGWGVDVVGRIWFCCNITMAAPCGDGHWWQVPMSEYFVQDATALDTLKSLASKFDPQKLSYLLSTSRGGLITAGPQGVWVCLEYKNILHVCRGSFQGYRWEDAHPLGMVASATWKTVSANVADLDWGLVWAQQPNQELYVFPANTRKATLISPSPMFKSMHAGPIAVWGLDNDGNVWVRAGMGPYCPQGATWAELDLSQLGDSQLIHVSCNSQYVWTVDCNGWVYQRIGAKAPTDQQLSPAWLPIDSFSEITFTQVVTGPLEWMVWAIDNRRLGYVRQGITDRMPIGREWVHVPGTQITELTVTKTGVWALNPHGEVLYRYGISRDNPCGNYWKKVPGVFAHLSASPTDDLWAISREGHLLQCRTKYFQRRQISNDPLLHRTLSGGSEGEGEGEWELV
ncbi:tectonin beta-propeller repeat-containing protein 2-like isoform X3 [Haliotis rubra]|uniref:tectonin beta-propeller repeat-containing protein 2-like isoform X1 n=1 Tax=Haliotis rubra TaxID=36100 RepID=UPI001EE51547|nr:tectonin beta-propeller repeat-containing protein 2-like isoform X1 [Haliotis rubra]XP_046579934.1 tectonin beta-propeller repeat-containing protein 2-like isoform X1 [Haliotis rubra]XP_046579935.1 tectonin beta-propeller repeat-containing protein 2-like isoform X2 [Haliotis rubra]XP_046579936.1 tectonin beta-propeller repeat-containing protein 2-like isoform X3 [Haliotis rubra]